MSTRKDKAEALLARLQRGPSISTIGSDPLSKAHAERVAAEYRGWVESWVLTEVCTLVPELRHHLDVFGYFKQPENVATPVDPLGSRRPAAFRCNIDGALAMSPVPVDTVEPLTGRVAVLIADFARSDLNGDASAYWWNPEAVETDPWRLVEGVDQHTADSSLDVWFASGAVKTVAPSATFFVSAKTAEKLATERARFEAQR